MTASAAGRLDQIAQGDPTIGPLARLQAEAFRAAADDGWAEGVPDFSQRSAEPSVPLLHQQTLRVDVDRVRRLLGRLADLAARQSGSVADSARALGRAVERGRLDEAALLGATIVLDGDDLATLAEAADVEAGLLATLSHLAALPLLQACGRQGMALRERQNGSAPGWQAGYCPVCAAWPTLAETRGLERQRWLRCGRCGAGWSYDHQRCASCGTHDHRGLGYLAAEAERDARQAITCTACRGYLKAVTTFGRLDPAEVMVQDLLTLELDLAAVEEGYSRPETPGFALEVMVEPLPRRARWLSWRR
jgi:FdhE protein